MTSTVFVVEEWTPITKNTLRGFAVVTAPSGLKFHDVGVHTKDGRSWASPASRPMLGRDGSQMKSADGKALWSPVLSFNSKQARDRWSNGVIEALRVSHPEALA